MQAAAYPAHSARAKGNLSKAAIVAAARTGDEAGMMQALALAKEAVHTYPVHIYTISF